jgi:hypothetical protein
LGVKGIGGMGVLAILADSRWGRQLDQKDNARSIKD